MKNILVPTDFSENSFNAVKYSLGLLQEKKCTFHILHVNPIPTNSDAEAALMPLDTRDSDASLSLSREQLKRMIKRIKEAVPNSGQTYMTLAVHDNFVDTIKREIQNRNIDLIIMGAKGATESKRRAIGSNTSDVITKVKCPLLIVPENATYNKPKEIAFPTDYHLGYDLNVLNNLMKMTEMNQSAIRIIHFSKKKVGLSEEQLTNKEFLNEYFKEIKHSFYMLSGNKMEAAVESFTKSRDIDMIAMVAKNLNLFQRILFRPAVEEISYYKKVPFLVLHE